MDNIKSIVTGGIITLVIGGTAFTFSQQDVINNFASDTGLTQEQAEQYVANISEDDLASWDEIGSGYVTESEESLAVAKEIDCVTYEYEWESTTVTCAEAKSYLHGVANSERSLGEAFIKLSSDTASEADIRTAIDRIDQLNSNYENEISAALFDTAVIEEAIKTNSYNKSVLKAALDSV